MAKRCDGSGVPRYEPEGEAAGSADFVRNIAMAKPREFRSKQPGSAGAKQPMATVRIPVDLVNRIDHWAGEHDAPTRVEAICKLVEIGLTAKDALPANNTLRERAASLADSQIDQMGDSTVTTEERATRKRRLTEGPSAFRDMRRDRPSRR
jgi:hypothetical protein